jgi:D-glycero-D-manno-heptose 1,7-bisphosphate phosphatase
MAEGRAQRAVFFDRDGVLSELVERDGIAVSPLRVEEFRIGRDALDAVCRIRQLGMRTFVVSNQPDIARGLLATEDLRAMNRMLQKALPIDEVMVCPHDDAARCQCRKPQPGMLLMLAERWNVDLGASFLIGDSWRDIEAGHRAGCTTILIAPSLERSTGAQAVVPSLAAAVSVVELRV